MSVNAKTLIKNKFWILEEDGHKIGTLQKEDGNGWIFLGRKDKREKIESEAGLFEKFGANVFSNDIVRHESVVSEDGDQVYDYPVSQKAYNPMFDVQKQLPIYTKTPKSKSLFCAGYYIICFEKGWRKAYCPKVITLQRYPYKGPYKTKLEMQQELNYAIKEQTANPTN
jgi:hypothetical protein